MSLQTLAELSRFYGSDPAYTVAGGGNTSYKDETYLYVKASGTALATIGEDGFVKMERARIREMWTKDYPTETDAREAAVLDDLLYARARGEYTRRPSVETPFHDLLPQTYVIHMHPALVNGMTCGRDGAARCAELFPEALWIPACEPGWILAVTVKEAVDAYVSKNGKTPSVIFLQNHGVIVADDTADGIKALYNTIMTTLEKAVTRKPDFTDTEFDRTRAAQIAPAVRMLLKEDESSVVTFFTNKDIAAFTASSEDFMPLSKPFIPDQMVYCKAYFLYVPAAEDMEEQYTLLQDAVASYEQITGTKPRVIAVEGLGFFAHGKTKKNADTAKTLVLDALKIAVYAESFGGALHLSDSLIDFIANWESEHYRQKMAMTDAGDSIAQKIIIVTGAAQGFGQGIAEELLAVGANVVIADLNMELAEQNAAAIREKSGVCNAIAVKADVGNEESVQAMIEDTVLCYGGLDTIVCNAGIARPGSLEEMSVSLFELMTKVNYTAFFLGAKYASRVMKIQHRFAPDYTMDIVQINSKSGLTGSNKNFAYAGSKFGGIGLTQSFALELTPYNIKVNAVCPGNYFEGPLWADPEKGLFVQYLNAGKVPGAKNVADVKKFYESKIPMNRGCLPSDVARAVVYCMNQKYETGQAIPVTGGQTMLK